MELSCDLLSDSVSNRYPSYSSHFVNAINVLHIGYRADVDWLPLRSKQCLRSVVKYGGQGQSGHVNDFQTLNNPGS